MDDSCVVHYLQHTKDALFRLPTSVAVIEDRITLLLLSSKCGLKLQLGYPSIWMPFSLWNEQNCKTQLWVLLSVTRSGDFLDFGQLFKAFGNN